MDCFQNDPNGYDVARQKIEISGLLLLPDFEVWKTSKPRGAPTSQTLAVDDWVKQMAFELSSYQTNVSG